MQQRIDCILLCTETTQDWAGHWSESLSGDTLRIRRLDISDATGEINPDDTVALLKETQLCLLPVCLENLSWARTWLNQVRSKCFTPILALTHDLRMVALRDLRSCGVADFLRAPACREELHIRAEQVLSQARTAQLDYLSRLLGTVPGERTGRSRNADEVCSIQNQRMAQYHNLLAGDTELHSFVIALATRYALHDAPFQSTKNHFVAGFESAYLSATLKRYGGNITQAAKAAQKHRRAFWELVCKHGIDPEQYRNHAKKPKEPESN